MAGIPRLAWLFILLAARIEPDQLRDVAVPSLVFLGLLVFVARPLGVIVSTVRTTLSWRERLFLMVMAELPLNFLARCSLKVSRMLRRFQVVGFAQRLKRVVTRHGTLQAQRFLKKILQVMSHFAFQRHFVLTPVKRLIRKRLFFVQWKRFRRKLFVF